MLPRWSCLMCALGLLACTGSIEPLGGQPGPGEGGVDAGDPADDSDAAPTSGDPQPDPGCIPIATADSSGNHNAGLNCMTAGCHAAGGEGPTFTLGGTLFKSIAGGAAQPGATITVRDANAVELSLQSAQNGNFWTAQALTFPVTVAASGCPDVNPMVGPVAATGAGCNGTACHDTRHQPDPPALRSHTMRACVAT